MQNGAAWGTVPPGYQLLGGSDSWGLAIGWACYESLGY